MIQMFTSAFQDAMQQQKSVFTFMFAVYLQMQFT